LVKEGNFQRRKQELRIIVTEASIKTTTIAILKCIKMICIPFPKKGSPPVKVLGKSFSGAFADRIASAPNQEQALKKGTLT
jgi:hypothetical protein